MLDQMAHLFEYFRFFLLIKKNVWTNLFGHSRIKVAETVNVLGVSVIDTLFELCLL